MNLYEALSIPYIRGAETVFDAAQRRWLRRFEYPELDDCVVETDATLEGLRELEVARVARIVELMAAGRPVPRPRPPLVSADPVLLLQRLGIDIGAELLATDESAAPHSPAFRAADHALAERTGRRRTAVRT